MSHGKSFITAAGLLSERLWRCVFRLEDYDKKSAEEFRLRKNKPMIAVCSGRNVNTGCTVFEEDIKETLARCTASSFHTFGEQIKKGYVTAPCGHRLGICGANGVNSADDITSLNLRIAKEAENISLKITDTLIRRGMDNILVISPSGGGKTTFLRDLAKNLSKLYRVSVADERCELFPVSNSEPVFDPLFCDVISGMDKKTAVERLICSMTPQIVVMDELYGERDRQAFLSAAGTGCFVAAGIHGVDLSDVMKRNDMGDLIDRFGYIVEIRCAKGERSYRLLKSEEENEIAGRFIDSGSVS